MSKILGAFCALAVLIAVGGYFFRDKPPSTVEFVSNMASQANLDAPRMLNEEIRIDGASANGKELITKYTLINFGVNEAEPDALLNMVKPGVVSQACSNSESISAFNQGVVLTYWYQDNAGNIITKLSIDKNSCQ